MAAQRDRRSIVSPLVYDAIVLAGGRSSRLGSGRNKALLPVGEATLLAQVVDAAREAQRLVVVAPPSTVEHAKLPSRVLQTLEDPPFGGPVAGILAGLAALDRASVVAEAPTTPITAILACDLPLARAAISELLTDPRLARLGEPGLVECGPGEGADGICALTETGWPERLLGFYRTGFLRRRAVAVGSGRDLSVRRFLSGARLLTLRLPEHYADDIDTQADWERFRQRRMN